jgi:putative transposase
VIAEEATPAQVSAKGLSPWVVSSRSLSEGERREVLNLLNSERFMDQAPREIYAALLDEGTYLCSVRTIYRLLEAERELRERRGQLRHPSYRKPELLASAPNRVWSWDLPKLLGPVKWSYYYLNHGFFGGGASRVATTR